MTYCQVCSEPITDKQIAERAYCQRVTGWALPPQVHRGGSSIVGRKVDPDYLAHVPCAQGDIRWMKGQEVLV